MSASERRRISGRRLNSLHPKSDLSREKRRPEIPLQPWFFVRQTEIILQTALLFSFFFLSFFGEALSSSRVAKRFVGCFSNYDGDGNQDVKKAIGLLRKTTTLQVYHAFLYISLPSSHDYDVKMPNWKFYGGRKQATTNLFFSL